MKKFKKCILHIGTEKTGTSTIQGFLAANRETLAHEGVIYPSATGTLGGSQWGFVGCVGDRVWSTDIGRACGIESARGQRAYRQYLNDALGADFAAYPDAEVLLISSEHFHSRLVNPRLIKALRDFLAPWAENFEVITYLRRQDRMAVSLYSTKIKSGATEPTVFPASTNDGSPPYYFDYERIHANWAAVFGYDALRMRLFDRKELVGGDLLQDFCITAGIDINGKRIPRAANESLDQRGVNFLLELNRQLPRSSSAEDTHLRARITAIVAELCRGKTMPTTCADALAFYDIFRDGNARLLKLAFPARSSPLFDDDFSEYPETLPLSPPSHGDAVTLAISIARTMEANPLPAHAPPPQAESMPPLNKAAVRKTLADNYYYRAMLALRDDRRAHAMDFLRRTLEIKDDHLRANLELARMLLDDNKPLRAKPILDRLHTHYPDGHPLVNELLLRWQSMKPDTPI